MSTDHEVRVVTLGDVIKVEGSDHLGVTWVDGRPCVIRLEHWAPGYLAVYVPVESLVPVSDHRFAFLADKANADGLARIEAKRLRKQLSMGLLVNPDWDMHEGDEVRERMGIGIYEPIPEFKGTDAESDPGFLPYYDLEGLRKWHRVLLPGEGVVLTEKANGENGRWTFHNGRMWAASHGTFKKRDSACVWWHLAQKYSLEAALAYHCPGIAVYGEAYGKVGGFKYGKTSPDLVLFDAYDIAAQRWLDYDLFQALAMALNIPVAPVLYRGPWTSLADVAHHAEGNSVLAAKAGAAHIREGFVLRLAQERTDPQLGRVILKMAGEGYLTRKER